MSDRNKAMDAAMTLMMDLTKCGTATNTRAIAAELLRWKADGISESVRHAFYLDRRILHEQVRSLRTLADEIERGE